MHSSRATNDNHKSLGQRLRAEMKKRGVSSTDLARMADVKTSFLYDVISGKSANPSSIKLARVAESLGISLTYLAGTSDTPEGGYEFSLSPKIAGYASLQQITVRNGAITSRERTPEPLQFQNEWLKAALGTPASELRLLMVESDNMQPTLLPGDTLIIDTTERHASPPGLFVFFDGVALVVKRAEFLPHSGKIRISCDDQRYAAYESLPEEAAIIGRVVWLSRAC